MADNSANSKRIAKNTILLYIRMIILLFISLYTSRVIISSLGIQDYGIYSVVGGIVAMFTFLRQSLSSAISRYLNYAMGKGGASHLKDIFATSVIIMFVLAISIAIISEIGGIWFLNNKMVIPDNRLYAANWVFQFTIISFCVDLICVPYNATIIAHEKMNAFAYIGIYEGLSKLLIAFLIFKSPIDKLIFYGLLLSINSIIIRFIYNFYCKKHFEESSFHFVMDIPLIKEIFGFAGWTFLGNFAGILRSQGGNILINLFGGPIVNAARGIAVQVEGAIAGFALNFMTAVNPQITKSYASGNLEYMEMLVINGSRFSFYLLFCIGLPIIINSDYILSLWLNDVPQHTQLFLILILIDAFVTVLYNPLITANNATGDIRKAQIIVSVIQLFNIPISYVLLKIGMIPEVIIIVSIVLNLLVMFARLMILKKQISLSIFRFIRKVLINCSIVTIASVICPLFLLHFNNINILYLIINISVCLISTFTSIYFVGLEKNERSNIYNIIKTKYINITKKN